jgi:hypothetical protein
MSLGLHFADPNQQKINDAIEALESPQFCDLMTVLIRRQEARNMHRTIYQRKKYGGRIVGHLKSARRLFSSFLKEFPEQGPKKTEVKPHWQEKAEEHEPFRGENQ